MRQKANTSWFNLVTQKENFEVYSFSGIEQVHTPYEFMLEVVSRSPNVDVASLLGTSASLSIQDTSGESRYVHGLIRSMEQLHTANRFTHYRAVIVPRLWFLGQITDHRIFQNLSVPEIIRKILSEQGFTATESKFSLFYKYEPREYCVMYGETYLHFISRVCEEEGIYFYFEHGQDSHCLCFSDREGGARISGEALLRYYQGSGQAADTATINRLRLHHEVHSNAAVYRDWNFTKPKLSLHIEEKSAPASAPVPAGMNLEQYRYPHIYQLRAEGSRYAQLQSMRQLNFSRWIELASDVSRFLPCYTFEVHAHDREDINAKWWVVSVQHQGSQPAVLGDEAPDGRGQHYQSAVTAIPEMTRYIPELVHPKNRVIGSQTALVTGPEGEEIFTDKYGRVKVQFFWDREGKGDDKTSCWIRVSQGWAGGQYGGMAIPRIGHEVVVNFLEGNPDRPLITGRVYHELNRVPYELPEHKTRTVFKSMSTPGKEGEPRGFNELRVEDKKGEEEIYLHAEKDVNTYTKNDWKDYVLHDKHQTVDNFTYLTTKGETHETLKGCRKTELFADDNLTVHGDMHTDATASWLCKTGSGFHVKAGNIVALEGGNEIILKAGGSFLRIGPDGVTAQGGKINLNSGGGCGSAKTASPLLPEGSVPTDPGICPTCMAALEEAEKDDAPFSGSCAR